MLSNFEVYRIAQSFYWACKPLKLPQFLKDQLLRASSSIVLNIAEGSAKRTPNDQARFYSIAFGSLRECQAILGLERIEEPRILEMADKMGAILFKLSRKASPKEMETETEKPNSNGNSNPGRQQKKIPKER